MQVWHSKVGEVSYRQTSNEVVCRDYPIHLVINLGPLKETSYLERRSQSLTHHKVCNDNTAKSLQRAKRH